MSEYTPTTDEVQEAFCVGMGPGMEYVSRAQFSRWRGVHDREVAQAARREQEEMDLAMHHAYRPEVVAELAVAVHDECDWDGIAAWCGGKVDSGPDGTDSGEWCSWIDVPGVGQAFTGMWIVRRHDLTFDLRYEVEGPSDQSVETLWRQRALWDEVHRLLGEMEDLTTRRELTLGYLESRLRYAVDGTLR